MLVFSSCSQPRSSSIQTWSCVNNYGKESILTSYSCCIHGNYFKKRSTQHSHAYHAPRRWMVDYGSLMRHDFHTCISQSAHDTRTVPTFKNDVKPSPRRCTADNQPVEGQLTGSPGNHTSVFTQIEIDLKSIFTFCKA